MISQILSTFPAKFGTFPSQLALLIGGEFSFSIGAPRTYKWPPSVEVSSNIKGAIDKISGDPTKGTLAIELLSPVFTTRVPWRWRGFSPGKRAKVELSWDDSKIRANLSSDVSNPVSLSLRRNSVILHLTEPKPAPQVFLQSEFGLACFSRRG